MQATSAENQTPHTGIPPGWAIIDEGWTTIANRHESRLIVALVTEVLDQEVFACYQRWGTALEFALVGWVDGYEEAESWLRNEMPGTMVTRDVSIPLPGFY